MMGADNIMRTFQWAGRDADLSIIEGNLGLYDGLDLNGSDSTSSLARILQTPIILVIDAGGMTRGIAPLISGYQQFESDIVISGIILNKVKGSRHEAKLRDAISHYCDLEVLGALPELPEIQIQERHLGLVPVNEDLKLTSVIESISCAITKYINLERMVEIARAAPPLISLERKAHDIISPEVCLGVAKDPVFSFYYPENLAALQAAGAELIPFNTLKDSRLPPVNGLYIGGGFPEVFMKELEENRTLREDIRNAVENGIAIYAECAGLIYLARSISWNEKTGEMVGAIPCDVEMSKKPIGHGYVVLQETGKNPWHYFETKIKGHEFHYSQVVNLGKVDFAYDVIRGKGIDGEHDGLIYKNVLASYTHLHCHGVPQWAEQFISFVKKTSFKF
jgi:cobyrinic acid a,c-diamide synthase